MSVKRIVDTDFWNDGKVMDLFSPEDKYFMLYLLTNPHTTQLGIYQINKKHMAFELGYSLEVVSVLIDRFVSKYGIIKYSDETKEIAIKNYLKYSIVKGGKPVEDLLIKEIAEVRDRDLLQYVHDNICACETLNDTIKKILPRLNVKEKVAQKEMNENDNDNGNDNDNDDSSTNRGRFVDDSLRNTTEEEYRKIKGDILRNKNEGEKICEWCGCKTTVLHKHHYPIPKRFGGTKTVNICSNCHHEFHIREIQLSKEHETHDSSEPICEETNPMATFFERWDVTTDDLTGREAYSLSAMDFEKINQAMERSTFLQTQQIARFSNFYIKNYKKIIAGYYDDDKHEQSKGKNTSEPTKHLYDMEAIKAEDRSGGLF